MNIVTTCLQHVVLDNFYPSAEALYLKHTQSPLGTVVSTDTYVNIFAQGQWREYTDVSSIALHVCYAGSGSLTLHTANDLASPSATEVITLPPGKNELMHPISCSAAYLWLSWDKDQCLTIKTLEWYGGFTTPVQDVTLSLCVPTYNRKEDITRAVSLYESYCAINTDFAKHSHLFVYNNNKQDDLGYLPDTSQTTIITGQENIGGAGAFNQMAHITVEQGFSHALFMDDDAHTHHEAWYRTITLLRHLRPEWQLSFVSATAFTRERPLFCHAVREAIDSKGRIKCYRRGDYDLQNFDHLQRTFSTISHDEFAHISYPYAAWWYCVIPTTMFVKSGYPDARLFGMADDIEFSLRNPVKVICLNGINVWHPDFNRPQTTLRRFLAVRNHYTIREIYFGKKWLLLQFVIQLIRLIRKQQYLNAWITLIAYIAFRIKRYDKFVEIQKKLKKYRKIL